MRRTIPHEQPNFSVLVGGDPRGTAWELWRAEAAEATSPVEIGATMKKRGENLMKYNTNNSQGPRQIRNNDNLAILRAHTAQGRSGTSAAYESRISGDTIRQCRFPRVCNPLDCQIDCVELSRSQESDTSSDLAREEERTKFTRHSVTRALDTSVSMGMHAPRPGSCRPTCRLPCSAGGVADRSSTAIALAEPRLAASDLKVQSMMHTHSASQLRLVVDRNAMRPWLCGIRLVTKAIWKTDAIGDR